MKLYGARRVDRERQAVRQKPKAELMQAMDRRAGAPALDWQRAFRRRLFLRLLGRGDATRAAGARLRGRLGVVVGVFVEREIGHLLIDLGVLKSDEKQYWLKENPSKIKFKPSPPALQKNPAVQVGDTVIPPNRLFQ